MFANFLIGLREGLEASLVVSILIAYVVRTDRRHLLPRIWAGVGVAAAISLAFGALLTYGPRGLSFSTQEAIGGFLSLIAVVFVTWMIFWMASAARGLAATLRQRVDAAAEAATWSLALVAALAVGREGLETALFLWAAGSAATGTGQSNLEPIAGAVLGLGLAIAAGWGLYRGALKINLTKFFTYTGVFLIVVAAGVLSYAMHDLQEAGLLGGRSSIAFDVSDVIVPGTWYATLLKGVFNFSPAPSVLEVVAWVGYLVPTLSLFLRRIRRRDHPTPTAPAPQPAATV